MMDVCSDTLILVRNLRALSGDAVLRSIVWRSASFGTGTTRRSLLCTDSRSRRAAITQRQLPAQRHRTCRNHDLTLVANLKPLPLILTLTTAQRPRTCCTRDLPHRLTLTSRWTLQPNLIPARNPAQRPRTWCRRPRPAAAWRSCS